MQKTATSVWKNCLSFIRDNISDEVYETWFLPIIPVALTDTLLRIEVPSRFFYEWLEEHYVKLLRMALVKELGVEAKLMYDIAMEKKSSDKLVHKHSLPGSRISKIKPQEVNGPISLDSTQIRNPFIIPGLKKMSVDPQLNLNYSFENFIEGESNRLARSAGKAIANRPGGTSFNPLFIYGNVGLGKTHLGNAIGIEVKEKQPEKTVLYVSAEKFTQQYVSAVKSNTRNDFIYFYQMIDILIVDDIHFLSGKSATQNAFFHIFNHLHQCNKQLIFTSDKSPVDIQDMERRLVSRFKWGLSADLKTPDFTTRVNILKNKLFRDGINIGQEIVEYIASKITSNIRELEGALISIMAQSSLNKKEITIDLVKQTLIDFAGYKQKEISIKKIQDIISNYFNISIDEIQSKTRKRNVVQARHLAMYFAKKLTKNSLANIGKQIGKRDHATVLYACKTVSNLLETNKKFKRCLEDIQYQLTKEK